MYRYFICISIIICLTLSLNAQKVLQAIKTGTAVIIDGEIDSVLYALPDSASGFIQMEPSPGSPSIENTVVYLLYDEKVIYVVFKCFQDPNSIRAKIQNRDNLTTSDDAVSFMFDTYNDQRTGFGFYMNPLGTQCDFKILDDGRIIDTNWDTEWESAVQIFSWGWYAEFAIPLKSIQFKQKINEWGINFSRVIRYNFETSWWSGEVRGVFRISQSGKLTGINIPKEKGKLTLFPYGTLRYEDSDFTGVNGKWKGEAGGVVAYQINSNLRANVTYNPDFATVEADQEQLNLSRYELSHPEKRLFFQEGNEMFSTRIRTFYSRRVGDIIYGAKLTGKVGKYNLNLLNVGAEKIPSLEEPQAMYTAFRVKRDILKSSTAGLTFVDKSWNGGFARSLSADYTLNLGKTWKLTGQFVGSAPGDFTSHSAYFLRFAKENNIYHYHIRYSSIGENFQENVNQTGFIVDDDRHELDSDINYTWWMKSKMFKYIEFNSNYNVFWSHKGILRSYNVFGLVNFYFQNKLNFEVFYNDEFKLFEKKYYNHKYGVEVGYNTDEWSMAKLNYWGGYNFDRDFHLFKGSARFKLSSKLAVEYSFQRIWYEPDTANYSTLINVLSVYYNFTKDLWVKVFAQNNSAYDHIYVYGLFGWRFKPPFGAVYLIYTRDELKVMPDFYQEQEDIFYIKLTYPIVVW
ncbi:MAG: carbohydrate binding family 9 domain-containing protein [Bacteroidales bacterium]|nr:carbohydrate binding family 9 domain-containing protein [Bacteroidales bacterium]